LGWIIEATSPGGPGVRNWNIFEAARWLLACEHFDGTDEMTVAFATRWYEVAKDHIRTKSLAAAIKEFRRSLKNVRSPKGAKLAEAYSIADKDATSYMPNPNQNQTARIFKALDTVNGGAVFPYPFRLLAEKLGVSPRAAVHAIRCLEDAKLIETVEKGVGTPGSGKANTYKWRGPLEPGQG
jgi:DNA-binding transcriptional ArsR family regulator